MNYINVIVKCCFTDIFPRIYGELELSHNPFSPTPSRSKVATPTRSGLVSPLLPRMGLNIL